MKRYGTIRLSPRRHAVIEYIGDGDSTWANGPFEHWRMVGKPCSSRDVRERLKALIGAAADTRVDRGAGRNQGE